MSEVDSPGLRVAGRLLLETVNPVPVTLALLTVREAVPVDFSVNVCFAGVFSATLPNVRLLVLQLIVETAGPS